MRLQIGDLLLFTQKIILEESGKRDGECSAGAGLAGATTYQTTCACCGSDAIGALRNELAEQKLQLDKILEIISGSKVLGNEALSTDAAQLSEKTSEEDKQSTQRKANRYNCEGIMASLCFPETWHT